MSRKNDPGLIKDWEWVFYKKLGFMTCEKCGYSKVIKMVGSTYCNRCGNMEERFVGSTR